MSDEAEIVGSCEWCGEPVATDQNRLNFGHMWWHRDCADRLRNALSAAIEFDAEEVDA